MTMNYKSPDEVEAVYYEAFIHCDAQVMATLWAEEDVICIHPGSGAIVGHESVVRSWQHIFTNAIPPKFEYTVAKRTRLDDLAIHVVAEQITDAYDNKIIILATNVYQKFEHGWLMIEHHASTVNVEEEHHTLQ